MWRLDRKGTIEILHRIVELENRVAILERERQVWAKLIDDRLDKAVKQLEPKIVDKCYCRVYEEGALVKLLELSKEEE